MLNRSVVKKFLLLIFLLGQILLVSAASSNKQTSSPTTAQVFLINFQEQEIWPFTWFKTFIPEHVTIKTTTCIDRVDALTQMQNLVANKAIDKREKIWLVFTKNEIDDNHIPYSPEKIAAISQLIAQMKAHHIRLHVITQDTTVSPTWRQITEATLGTIQFIDHTAPSFIKALKRLFAHLNWLSTAPITKGQFKIDESVNTFYVLALGDAENFLLQTPSRIRYTLNAREPTIHGKQRDQVLWLEVQQPEKGTWRIWNQNNAEVMLLLKSDLRLMTEGVPTKLYLHEIFGFTLWMEENNKLVVVPEFINNLILNFISHKNNESAIDHVWKEPYHVLSSSEFMAGVFKPKFSFDDATGIYQLEILATGRTYQRNQAHQVEVLPVPLSVQHADHITQVPRHHTVEIVFDPNQLRLDTLNVTATIDDPWFGLRHQAVEVKDNRAKLNLVAIPMGKQYHLKFMVKGFNMQERSFTIAVPAITIPGQIKDEQITNELKRFAPQLPYRLQQPQPRLLPPALTPAEKAKLEQERQKKIALKLAQERRTRMIGYIIWGTLSLMAALFLVSGIIIWAVWRMQKASQSEESSAEIPAENKQESSKAEVKVETTEENNQTKSE